MQGGSFRSSRPLLGVIALALAAAACASGASASSGGGQATLKVSSPSDGATVSSPFTVKLDASVPLGAPSTGEDHVHLCFDGASCDSKYTLVYGNSISIKSLSPGQHTIEASLRNADHSDTGVSTTISVTVSGTGANSGGTSTGSTGSGGGYGY